MIFLSLLLSATLFGPYPASVVKIIDGDTVRVSLEVYPDLFQTVAVRIVGVNAPETHTKSTCEKLLGLQAKKFVVGQLAEASNLSVIITGKGKYAGRMLGDLLYNNKRLSTQLLLSNNAVKYTGGTRSPWCKD